MKPTEDRFVGENAKYAVAEPKVFTSLNKDIDMDRS
jgi:hypothetical protein